MILPSLTLFALALGAKAAVIDTEPISKRHIVPGLVFDRYIAIMLENTNYEDAINNPNFAALASKGLQLTNLFAVTHPSQPNYLASVGGDYFGMDHDDYALAPGNIATIVDLLEERGISWAEYQEHMPETGWQGFAQPNAEGQNDYVRKHNPLINYASVTSVSSRLNNIKNFTLFEKDLHSDNLPQWMFITPNMTNDGHDTDFTFSGAWAANFLTPLLEDRRFNAERTLIVLTFDENGYSEPQNRIDTILLGTAVPKALVGKHDDTFYNHYSTIATVEANWRLSTLGRYDVGANVFKFVAKVTGDTVRTLRDLSSTFLNESYQGPFNSNPTISTFAIPNTRLVVNGRSVLSKVKKAFGSPALQACTPYKGALEIPSALNPPIVPPGC